FFLQRIPKKFTLKYGVHLTDTAFLTIPNGTKWKVKLTKRDGEVWFQNGWCEFASCHALTLGHLLVFKYEGNSQFYVLIFDATTTEIDYPLDDQLQVHRMEDNDSDDNSLEIMDGFMPSRKKREKPPLPCPLPHKRAKSNPGCSHLQAGDTHFKPELTKSKGNSLVRPESNCNLDDVSFSHDQCPKKDGGVGMSTNQRRLKAKAVVKNQEYKALEIKQELMTTNGKIENLVRANAIKSDNPLFTVIIHLSYLNGKDRAFTPWHYQLLTERRIYQGLHERKYIHCEAPGMYRSSSCVISGGWYAFARENTLRVGDVCVFELIMRDDVVLKVHIFRCLN
ncbi:hypothetical protein ACB092_01G191600, partial [Castanea dentata]